MTWIKFLLGNHIKYHLYKIKKEDSIIIKKINDPQIIIILSGTSYIAEKFTNNEISPIAILKTNNTFTINNSNRAIYYKIIPLETTYILNVEPNKIINRKFYMLIYKNKSKNYIVENNKIINTIIKQKNISNRIIQLILTLCLNCGHIRGKNIYIPFSLSNKDIAILTGTSENSVTKIINKLYKSKVIKKIDRKIILLEDIKNLKLE